MDQPPDRKWLVLVTVAIAQLMVVLDVTIVNIALPRAQDALHFANSDRQWIITAYALTFGGLLLLGGRLGDLFGRKGAFMIGLVGFAGASALGGAAPDFAVLAAARALQGAFGAVLAPSALATLANTFQEPAERGKAFGVFGAVAGGGSAVGLVLGGVLTEYLSWRYCLYVNVIFAIIALIGAASLLHNERHPSRPKLDLPGTALACLGLFGVVYGFAHAETNGWVDTVTLVSLGAGALVLVVFVVVEHLVAHPLLPLRVVTDRTRGGSFVAVWVASIAIFAVFLFVTFYLQTIVGFSPVRTGLAFLPLTAGILTASTTSNVVLLHRVGPRLLVATGMVFGAAALLGFTQLDAHSAYAAHVMPELVVLGLGFGLIIAPSLNMATAGVAPTDAGVASAMANTMQQIGGSIGTALLSTVAADAASRSLRHAVGPAAQAIARVPATLHGYHVAFLVAACTFAGGAIVCGALIRSRAAIFGPRAAAGTAPVAAPPEPVAAPAGQAAAPVERAAPPWPDDPRSPATPVAGGGSVAHLGTSGNGHRPADAEGTGHGDGSVEGRGLEAHPAPSNGNGSPPGDAAPAHAGGGGVRADALGGDEVELSVSLAVRWHTHRATGRR